MAFSLASQLKKRIKEKKLTVRDVERLSELKQNAVRNITAGSTKNPGVLTLKAIAQVLKCSVDDLLQDEEFESLSAPLEKEDDSLLPLEYVDLFVKASQLVGQRIKERELKITVTQAFKIAKGIYSYASKKKSKEIDMEFVEWYFDEALKS